MTKTRAAGPPGGRGHEALVSQGNKKLGFGLAPTRSGHPREARAPAATPTAASEKTKTFVVTECADQWKTP